MAILKHVKIQMPCNAVFLDELGVEKGATTNDRMENHNRIFKTAVAYGDTNYTNIRR